MPNEEPRILIDDKKKFLIDFINSKPKITHMDKPFIISALLTNKQPQQEHLKQIYEQFKEEIDSIQKKEIIIGDDDKTIFQFVPNLNEHQCITVFGQSGSGKSCYIAQLCKEIRKQDKKKPIYLISKVNEDEALDKGFDPL